MASRSSWLAPTLVAILAVGALGYFQVVRPTISRAKQVRTCADMQAYRQILGAYQAKHSHFPATLPEGVREAGLTPRTEAFLMAALDGWGHPLHYETQGSGSAYILVSYGADGAPDGTEYWWVRSTFGERRYAPEACPTFNADLIASDLEFHRPCGK